MNEEQILTTLAINSTTWTEVAEDIGWHDRAVFEDGSVQQVYRYPLWAADPVAINRAFDAGKILKAKRRRADGIMTVVVKKR